MSRATKILDKFRCIEEKYKPSDFEAPFSVKDFKSFSSSFSNHNFEKQVEPAGEGEVVLTKSQQKELARTSNVFDSTKEAEKRRKSIDSGLASQANKAIKKVATKLKIKPKGIKVDAETLGDFESAKVVVTWKGDELELDAGFYGGQEDEGAIVSDAADSWDWAAWLMSDDSPFEDSSFRDAYIYDNASQAAEELADLNSQGDLEDKIKEFLQKVVSK